MSPHRKNIGADMDAGMLREGIFNLNTRRFGTVAEVMIRRLFKLGRSKNQFHDLYDDLANHRVEVKETLIYSHFDKRFGHKSLFFL